MKLLFGISFVTGIVAGLAEYTVKSSAPQQTGGGNGASQPFNPGNTGSGVGAGSGGVSPGLGLMITEGWPTPFDEPLDFAGDVNDQVSSGTWTQAMAWTDYDMAVSAGGWQSWDSYVQELSAYGVDYSGFSAPPGGNTPPGGTTSNTAGSGASNPGWQNNQGIDPGLQP